MIGRSWLDPERCQIEKPLGAPKKLIIGIRHPALRKMQFTAPVAHAMHAAPVASVAAMPCITREGTAGSLMDKFECLDFKLFEAEMVERRICKSILSSILTIIIIS